MLINPKLLIESQTWPESGQFRVQPKMVFSSLDSVSMGQKKNKHWCFIFYAMLSLVRCASTYMAICLNVAK